MDSGIKGYMEELHELRSMLKVVLNKEFLSQLVELAQKIDDSYVSTYCRISESSQHGKNCGYAVKAKDLFVRLQEAPIREKITYIYKTFIEEK